jgi:hypothetical protein
MPQIIMLNHAAWVNGKRYDSSPEEAPTFQGKKIDELNTDQFVNYLFDGAN